MSDASKDKEIEVLKIVSNAAIGLAASLFVRLSDKPITNAAAERIIRDQIAESLVKAVEERQTISVPSLAIARPATAEADDEQTDWVDLVQSAPALEPA